MPEDSFEAKLRALSRELSDSFERAKEQMDYDRLAGFIGVDPERAREWLDGAESWLRAQTEHLGADAPAPAPEAARPRPEPARQPPASDSATTWRAPEPHPLDLPTDEQGAALAALDSGRWGVEPGTEALTARGTGPGPSDSLGLVRELRVRDWLADDGTITLAGRRALSRWLESAPAARG